MLMLHSSKFRRTQTLRLRFHVHLFFSNCRYDATVDDLIDVAEGNRGEMKLFLLLSHLVKFRACCLVYIPCLYVMNKIDTITIEELDILSEVPHYVPICAGHEWNFDSLLESIWSYLNMLRM